MSGGDTDAAADPADLLRSGVVGWSGRVSWSPSAPSSTAAGCYRVQLASNAVRAGAQRFCERHGFVASHVGS